MKNTLSTLLALGAALVLATPVPAQETQTVQAKVAKEMATDRAQLQSDRQAVVAENLPLSETEAAVFWPLYREYRLEMQKLGDRGVNMIVDYAKNFESMTDEQATKLVEEYLTIQKDEVKLRSDWAPKFRKVLPATKVMRFYQIENKIDAILRFDAADQVPLVQIKR
jgi:hypothetical protein